eukprot:1026368-Pelagomonas_calceolata.AAC.2
MEGEDPVFDGPNQRSGGGEAPGEHQSFRTHHPPPELSWAIFLGFYLSLDSWTQALSNGELSVQSG